MPPHLQHKHRQSQGSGQQQLMPQGLQLLLLAGRLGERFGPGRVTAWGGIATALVAFPVFWLMDQRSGVGAFLAVSLGLSAVILAYGVAGPALTLLFPNSRDGLLGVRFVAAVVRSSEANGAWVSVEKLVS